MSCHYPCGHVDLAETVQCAVDMALNFVSFQHTHPAVGSQTSQDLTIKDNQYQHVAICRLPRPSSPGTPPAVCEATPFSELAHPERVPSPVPTSFIMQGMNLLPVCLTLKSVTATLLGTFSWVLFPGFVQGHGLVELPYSSCPGRADTAVIRICESCGSAMTRELCTQVCQRACCTQLRAFTGLGTMRCLRPAPPVQAAAPCFLVSVLRH